MKAFLRLLTVVLVAFNVFLACNVQPSFAWIHGRASTSGFNNGTTQVNPNFTGIGGDYPFINRLKNTSGSWSLRDNSGSPTPADLDSYSYPLPGSDAITNHLGVQAVVRMEAQRYIGGNCLPGTNGSGYCAFLRMNGKGTGVVSSFTVINTSTATATVATGATTVITFSQAQDFRAGMEVPISGTTGVSLINATGSFTSPSGAQTAWTVCATGLTPTTIQLCLGDQTTPLQTSGTAGGTTVVTYGRLASGVPSGARVVGMVTTSPTSINIGISAQDASTPITYRNGIDGLVFGLQGSEETRYDQGQIFGAQYLAKLRALNPGVIRSLNQINTNSSLEVKWADRRPIGYFSYGSDMYDRPTSVWAGTTSSSNLPDYSISFGSGAPVDGQQISLYFDSIPVTVSSGAGAIITWASPHNLANGAPITFGALTGGAAPGGVTVPAIGTPAATYIYYAITTCGSCDATHTQFATSVANALAGTAVTTSSTGSNLVAHGTTAASSVTLTSGNPSIGWTNNLLNVNDPVTISGIGTLSYPLNPGKCYYVKTAATNAITISATIGGATITPLNNGTYQATRCPTLSLNGTTPVPIMDDKGFGLGTVKSTQIVPRLGSGSGAQRAYGVMTYDGVLNTWIKKGADTSLGTSFFTSGWPPEIFLRQAKEIGAHPWFQPPAFTVDGVNGPTDYNPSLYAMVKTNQEAWMAPHFEVLPNEFWNATNFAATDIMVAHAVSYVDTYGWTANTGTMQIAGKIASQLGQAVNAVYGGVPNPARYRTIIGVQTFNFSTATGPTTNLPRLTSTDYVANGPAQGYTQTPAYKWANRVATAQYYYPGFYNNFVGTSLAAANNGGVINGSIAAGSAGSAVLTVASTRSATTPAFGIGSVLMQGPGVIPGTTVIGGTAPTWTLDLAYPDPVAVGTNTDILYLSSTTDPTAAQTFIDSSTFNGTFTGTIASCVLTASGVTGYITTGSGSGGDLITWPGGQNYVIIASQLTGTQGKDGTYQLNTGSCPTNVASPVAMTSQGQFSITAENLYYQRIASWAGTYCNGDGSCDGVNSFQLKINGYEGGYSPDMQNAGYSLADQLQWRGSITTSSPGSATGIYGIVRQNCLNFKAAGGEFCSLFQLSGITPANQIWGALDDVYQPSPTPYFDAYKDGFP